MSRLSASRDTLDFVALQAGAAIDACVLQGTREGKPASVYDACVAPKVDIGEYLRRFAEFTECGAECLVVALTYVQRMQHNTGIALCDTNVHRVLFAALVVALKWQGDDVPGTTYLAAVGGVDKAEVPRLERTMLLDLEFAAHVSADEYATNLRRLSEL